jgi:predicted HTH transcriptional regulator
MTNEELTKHLEDSSFDEGQFIDFKGEIEHNKEYDLAKDISSFANAQGGRIFIGIENNKELKNNPICYPIKNWESMNSEDLSNQTRNKLSNFLSHSLHFTVTPVNIPNKKCPILIIEISKSATICGYRRTLNSSYEFWHRIDRQNVAMGIAQIIEKSLGSNHHREQLIISREFAKLLKQRFRMVVVAIHTAYGETKEGKSFINQPIPESSINKIRNLKTMVIPASKKTYTNLASLSFLSANINSDLKQLAIALTNKLAKVIADDGSWNLDDKTLGMLKQRETNPPDDIILDFFYQSNSLLKDYQCLLDIEVEINKKITALEAAGLSPFSTSVDFNQEYSLSCSGDLPHSV